MHLRAQSTERLPIHGTFASESVQASPNRALQRTALETDENCQADLKASEWAAQVSSLHTSHF